MTRHQATYLIWFIKFTVRFLRPDSLSPSVSEYMEEERRIIDLLSDEEV